MAQHSMIGALLDNAPIGTPQFDQLLTDHFMQQTHISHCSPAYLVHFLLGFSSMLLSDENQEVHGIKQLFYGWYPESELVKFYILTNNNGEKKLHIRTFFLNKVKNNAPRLISKSEYDQLKDLIHVYAVKNWAHKRFMEAQESRRLTQEITWNEFFRKYITDLENSESRSSEHIHLDAYVNLKKNELDEYKRNFKEYTIKKTKTAGSVPEQQHTVISVHELFNEKMSLRALKEQGFIPLRFSAMINTKFYPEKQPIDFRKNTLFLTNSIDYVLGKHWITTLSRQYCDIYSPDFQFGINTRMIKEFLTPMGALYHLLSSILGYPNEMSEAREGAFVHGSLLTLSEMSPMDIRMVQHVQQSDEVTNAHDEAIDHYSEFYIRMEPNSISDMNTMASRAPIVITFFNRRLDTNALAMCSFKNTLIGRYILVNVDLLESFILISIKEIPYTRNFIEDVFVESHLDIRVDGRWSLKNLLTRRLDRIQPLNLEHRYTDINYLSRYFLGLLASSPHNGNQYRMFKIQEARPSVNSAGQSYLVRSKQKFKNDMAELYIVFNFEETMSEDQLSRYTSADPMTELPPKNYDTAIVTIRQHFQVKSSEPNAQGGFLTRTIDVKYAQLTDVVQHHDLIIVDPFPLYDFVKFHNAAAVNVLEKQLVKFIEMHRHLTNSPVLGPEYDHLVDHSSNFRAILDGLFHGEPMLKNIIPLKSALSTVQYTLLRNPIRTNEVYDSGSETDSDASSIMEVDLLDDDLDDFDSDNDNSFDNSVQEMSIDYIYTIDNLITLNFKFASVENNENLAWRTARGMIDMLHATARSSPNNKYFNIVIKNGENLEAKVMTNKEINAQCAIGTMRRKRHSIGNCLDYLKKKRKTYEDVELMKNFENMKDYESLPKARMAILERLAKISNFAMMGFMLRDAFSDGIHGNKLALAKDVGFLVATVFSPTISKVLAQRSEMLIADGSKISGYATKALGFGISRAISLYVLGDFISNAVAYAKDTNDTNALTGMAVDCAFLTIDAITICVEGLEMAGIISGMAATVGPIGAIIGAAIIIGLNVYQTAQKVSAIDKIVELNTREMIDESFRAFFHLDIASNVQELMNEDSANSYLMKKAAEFLDSNAQFDTYITKSGDIVDGKLELRKNAVIDMETKRAITVSRASPTPTKNLNAICRLHQEAAEIEQPTVWTKIEGFFARIAKSFQILVKSVQHDTDGVIKLIAEDAKSNMEYGYSCHNSFGVQKYQNSPNDKAFFQLGDGHDVVQGMFNKSNLFRLGSGFKLVNGSIKNDKFVLTSPNVSGALNGGFGIDTIDFSALRVSKVLYLYNNLYIKHGSEETRQIQLQNIEELIGRNKQFDHVTCGCFLKLVQTQGGTTVVHDFIKVPKQSCLYNVTIIAEGTMAINNAAENGNFVYIVSSSNGTKVHMDLTQGRNINNTIIIKQSLLLINAIQVTNTDTDLEVTLTFIDSDAEVEIFNNDNSTPLQLYFLDGAILNMNRNISSITLNTELKVEDIVRLYSAKVAELKMPMVAYSTVDLESVTFAHGVTEIHGANNSTRLLNVVHNALDQKASAVLNSGDYLILINGTCEKEMLQFPHFALHPNVKSDTRVTVDFNMLIAQQKAFNKELDVQLVGKQIKDDLEINVTAVSNEGIMIQQIGRILIVDAYLQNFFGNIIVQSYGTLKVLKLPHGVDLILPKVNAYTNSNPSDQLVAQYLTNALEPIALDYGNNFNLILLSSENVEWFSQISINLTVDNLQFFHMNHTSLIITNAATNELWDYENLCTIFIENYFQYAKLRTLTIKGHSEINLMFEEEKINDAASVVDMWNLIQQRNDFYDSFQPS